MRTDFRRHLEAVQRPMQRTCHVCRRFAGGRGQSDTRQFAALVAQQRQQLGYGGGFAGARTAADEHKRLQQRQRRRIALPFAARLCKPGRQIMPRLQPIRRFRRRTRQAHDFRRQIAFQLPHPAEKQTPAVHNQRCIAATAHHRLRRRQGCRLGFIQPHKRMTIGQCGKQTRQIRRGRFRRFGRVSAQQRQRRIGSGLVGINRGG